MINAMPTFEAVQQLHQQGCLAEAKQGYEALLTLHPEDDKLLHMMSLL